MRIRAPFRCGSNGQGYSKSIHVRALIRAGSGSRTGQRPSHNGFAHIDRVESLRRHRLERPRTPNVADVGEFRLAAELGANKPAWRPDLMPTWRTERS